MILFLAHFSPKTYVTVIRDCLWPAGFYTVSSVNRWRAGTKHRPSHSTSPKQLEHLLVWCSAVHSGCGRCFFCSFLSKRDTTAPFLWPWSTKFRNIFISTAKSSLLWEDNLSSGEIVFKNMFGYSLKLTGSDFFGCLGSSGVVLDDVDGDFILLSWSKAWLEKLVFRGWKGAHDFSIFFFL